MSNHSDRCVNPLKKMGEKGHVGKSLRKIPSFISKELPHLSIHSRVCTSCIKKCKSEFNCENMDTVESNILETSMEVDEVINDSGISTEDVEARSPREVKLEELINGLKEKFSSLSKYDPLKVRILTIIPPSWSSREIESEFGASRTLVRKSKKLRESGGVLAETTKRTGKVVPNEISQKVIEFYNSDLNSRMMPGVKDCVTLKIDGKNEKVQKRLILMNLKELYATWKNCHPKVNISFSAFAKLRPKNCIFPGASGTHSVCVCTMHQNVKLMLDAIDVTKLTKNSEMPITNYKDCLSQMVCSTPTNDCHLGICKKCPGTTKIAENLSNLLDESCILNIQFSTWAGTDRSTLVTNTLPAEEFINQLCQKLDILNPHSFIAKQQKLFVSQKKEELRNGEVLVMFDFSENYAYVCQDASQAFHYNNEQCTVFTCIYYYKEKGKLLHKSHIFLSDCTKHDTAAVYTVQKMLIPMIQADVKNLNKIIYITDGAKQHFKNRLVQSK